MPGESKNGMPCAEFDALLSEALDETLTGAKLEGLQAHARVCSVCGPMLAEADAGRRWLKSLAEVEPPVGLVHNVLAATTGRESKLSPATDKPRASWKDVLAARLQPVWTPLFGVVRQPRFAMSFGMAFFSLSISLSMVGVKLSDVRHLDLRPSAIRRAYYQTTGKVVKYYENIRFVYEIESRVQQFKRATAPSEPASERKRQEPKNNTSGQPEQRQERNYSRGESQLVLASILNDPSVVTVTTYRRLA